jgi:hypothetical protein
MTTHTVSDFESGLAEFKGKKSLKFLQIGVFTGNASAWLLKNILTDPSSLLVDIDPWCGNLPHESVYDWDDIQEAYKEQDSTIRQEGCNHIKHLVVTG